MAYDEGLAHRLRERFEDDRLVTEKKMFGGLCFLHAGRMVCGIVGDELMLRVGPDAYEEVLARDHAREMDFTGRSLRGMVYVASEGLAADDGLRGWLQPAVGFAGGLPPKK